MSGTCIVCVVGGGGAAVNNIYKYLQVMYGSSSLCLSDRYALVIDQLRPSTTGNVFVQLVAQ